MKTRIMTCTRNPVARFAWRANKPKVVPSKKLYSRKRKWKLS